MGRFGWALSCSRDVNRGGRGRRESARAQIQSTKNSLWLCGLTYTADSLPSCSDEPLDSYCSILSCSHLGL